VEGRVRAFTMSPATVDPRPGGAFTWFGGSVEGTFTELEPPRRILMNWRFSSWGEGVASRVELAMEEPEPGATVLRLTQTEIPEEDRFGNHDVKLQVRPRGPQVEAGTQVVLVLARAAPRECGAYWFCAHTTL
jgi:activator of HSP90 ATPase